MGDKQHDSIGDIIIRLGELAFGGIVLGGILTANIDKIILILSGLFVSVLFISLGYYFNKKRKEN